MTILEELKKEITRNEELLEIYREITAGSFGAAFIDLDIREAKEAIRTNNVVEIVRTFKRLKENN